MYIFYFRAKMPSCDPPPQQQPGEGPAQLSNLLQQVNVHVNTIEICRSLRVL